MASLTMNVKLPVCVYEEADVYIAKCDCFDLQTQGCSLEDAKKNIIEAVGLFLETCFEMGTLEEVLKDCGFKLAEHPEPPQQQHEEVEVILPFILANTFQECHA